MRPALPWTFSNMLRHPPAPPGSGRQVCKEGHGRAPGFCSEDYYAAWNKSFPLSGTRILHLQEERVGLGILKSLPELRVGQPTLFLLFFFYVIYQTSLLECWYFTNSQGVFVSASCRQQTAAYQPQNSGSIWNKTYSSHTERGRLAPQPCVDLLGVPSGLPGQAPPWGSAVHVSLLPLLSWTSSPGPACPSQAESKRASGNAQGLLRSRLETVRCHFRLILLAKASHMMNPRLTKSGHEIHNVTWRRAWIRREGRTGALT